VQRTQGTDSAQRRTILWAVGLSVLIHLLLVIFSVWFPLGSTSTVSAATLQDQAITFDFANTAEATAEDPAQDVPFRPVEPQAETAPVPLPLPEQPPSPPVEEQTSREPQELVDEAPAASEVVEEVETVEQPADQNEPAGSEFARDPEALDRQAPQTAPPGRSLDIEEALRDFGRALERSRPATPPSSPAPEGSNVIVPDLSVVPMTGFGMGNLVFESRDYDWSDYGRQVYMAIWRAWHNRLWVTADDFEKWAAQQRDYRLDDSTQVHFVIERNGQVTGIYLENSTQCEPFDASALESLEEVILPPLPAGFPRDREVVHARFIGKGPIRAMRPNLRRMRQLGYF